MLKEKFHTLCRHFSEDNRHIETLYQEIQSQYSAKGRYYHTLHHLSDLYEVLKGIELNPLYEFALFYHDIIYDVQQHDNENRSALLALNRLQSLNVPQALCQEVYRLILATKEHEALEPKQALFLDADIAILGTSLAQYQDYTRAIRQEYQSYDETNYQQGRRKVLKNFLTKPKIYLTDKFQELYEAQARENLTWELEQLHQK